jgi:hypothetical protein
MYLHTKLNWTFNSVPIQLTHYLGHSLQIIDPSQRISLF